MSFGIGHSSIKRRLLRFVERPDLLPPVLLFTGPEGVGKTQFAKAFAKALLGAKESSSHPDLFFLQPEGRVGMHRIDALRTLCDHVALSPYQAERKVFIIGEAHRMFPAASNALLKTFEEPTKNSVMILITHLPNQLLPTIRSRCQQMRFGLLHKEEMVSFITEKWGVPDEEAASLATRARGSLGRAERLLKGETNRQEEQMLELLKTGPYSYLAIQQAASTIGGELEEKRKAAEKEIVEGCPDQLPATLREALQREAEGVSALLYRTEVQHLFSTLLFWYRDLQLLRVGGDQALLYHPAEKDILVQLLQRGGTPSLEKVTEAIEQASLALERSTAAARCLEMALMGVEAQVSCSL